MREPELRTIAEALRKYKTPWYYDGGSGDICDAGGHYIMACYEQGIADIVLRGANTEPWPMLPSKPTLTE